MAIVLTIATNMAAMAGDWDQWRGPGRNGVAEQSPPLMDIWPAEGLKPEWVSETDTGGGHGSVVVANGRVYCLAIRGHTDLVPPALTRRHLSQLGWTDKLPADLLKALEEARVSPERQALDKNNIRPWIDNWIKGHLNAQQKKRFHSFVRARLMAGRAAIEIGTLEKLAPIADQTFPNQEAMDAWFETHGIPDTVRKAVNAKIPKKVKILDDEMLCVDARTGKTLWRKRFPNKYPNGCLGHGSYAASGTPCVADGRCYVVGMHSAHCLNAATGELIWTNVVGGASGYQTHGSFAVVDGVAAVANKTSAIGFDARTGKRLWEQEKVKVRDSSAAVWRKDGKGYLIYQGGHCLDAATGNILWSFDGGGGRQSSPVVEGDKLLIWAGGGLTCYDLSIKEARRAWHVDCPVDWASSPTVYKGHVYTLCTKGSVCVELDSGAVKWRRKGLRIGSYASPVFADGKLFAQGGKGYGDGSLIMLSADPAGVRVLGTARIKQVIGTSPAFSDGRLYCRCKHNIMCFDLSLRTRITQLNSVGAPAQ